MTRLRKQEQTRNFGEEVCWKSISCTDKERQDDDIKMVVIVRGSDDFNVVELDLQLPMLSEKFRQCYMNCDIDLHRVPSTMYRVSIWCRRQTAERVIRFAVRAPLTRPYSSH